MLPYFSLYGLLSLLGLRDYGQRTVPILIASSIFLIWFAGLRFYVGCDYHSYYIRYRETALFDWQTVFASQESGFSALTYVFAKAGASFSLFQAFVTACMVFLYAKFIVRHQHAMYLLALLFPILILQLGMSGMRQALAVGFVMLAYNAFIDKRRLLVGVWVFVAFSFHSSAMIILPMAFLAGRDISLPRLIAGFVLLAPLAALLLGDRAEVYFDRYIDEIYGDQSSSGAWIRYLFVALPAILFANYRAEIKAKYPDVYQLLLLGALFIAALVLTGLISSVALHRLTFYAFPLSILMTLYVSLAAARDPRNGFVFWLAAYGVYICVWFLFSSHAAKCYIPYQNVTFFDVVVPAWALNL